MSEHCSAPGTILWVDLTVPNAEQVRDFYAAVTGWQVQPVPMGGYDDYSMVPPGRDQGVAGVCHARGVNARLPPQWIVYVAVTDFDARLAECVRRGGTVVDGPRPMGDRRFCVVRDPAGACLGLAEA